MIVTTIGNCSPYFFGRQPHIRNTRSNCHMDATQLPPSSLNVVLKQRNPAHKVRGFQPRLTLRGILFGRDRLSRLRRGRRRVHADAILRPAVRQVMELSARGGRRSSGRSLRI